MNGTEITSGIIQFPSIRGFETLDPICSRKSRNKRQSRSPVSLAHRLLKDGGGASTLTNKTDHKDSYLDSSTSSQEVEPKDEFFWWSLTFYYSHSRIIVKQ